MSNPSLHYPFGMVMPGRSYSSPVYRYGFNGKENDVESETQDYGYRIYNPSLCKFLSIDPLSVDYPWWSPYTFAGNSPIVAVDMDGLEIVLGSTLIPRWGAILELAKPETIIRPSPVIPPGEIAIPPGVIIPKTPPGIQVGQQKVEMAENPPAGVNWESPPAPEDLGEDWEETTSKESGKQDIHKEYTNKKTGQKINFDKGDPSKTGWKKVDHYHVRNPVSKNKGDYYLDKYGKPCSKGSEASHLEVVRKVVLREVVIKAKKLNMYQKLKIWYKRDKEKREQEDYIRKGGTMS